MKKATVSGGSLQNGFTEPLISLQRKEYQMMSQYDKQPGSTIPDLDEVARISWPDIQAFIDEIQIRYRLTEEEVIMIDPLCHTAMASTHMCRYCAPDNPSAA